MAGLRAGYRAVLARQGYLVLAVLALGEMLGRLRFQPGAAARPGVVVHGQLDVPVALLLVLLVLLCTVPLGLPRPAVAAPVIGAACVASLGVFGLLTGAGAVALTVAAFGVGRHGPAVLAFVLGLPFAGFALAGSGPVRVYGVLLAFGVPAAALAGAAWRARGSARLLGAFRDASEGSMAEYLARGERARIARDLHDVVAHHISMIAVQAETARLTTPGMPEAGARRLREIGDTARAGLTEMRRLLGVLREDAASLAEPPAAQRRPQPGLAQLISLFDEARETACGGVRLIMSGAALPMDPGTELAAYRIVQEALTNARRHAPGAAVDVELRFGVGQLRIRVRDNGPGASVSAASHGGRGLPGGHGLLGMRERAQAVGGSLRTGPAASGGFLVEALLPAGRAEDG